MATLSPRSLLAVHPLSPWLLEEMQLADWPPGSAGPRGPPAHTFHVEGQLLMPRPGAGTPLATAILKPCRPHPLPVGHLLLPPWARGLPAPPHGPLGPLSARAPRPAPRSARSARHGRCRPRWNLFLPRAHFPAFLRRGVILTISPQALPPPASWGCRSLLASSPYSNLPHPPTVFRPVDSVSLILTGTASSLRPHCHCPLLRPESFLA